MTKGRPPIEMLKRCRLGFQKHAQHWQESAKRTSLIEDRLRAENAKAFVAEIDASLRDWA